MPSSSYPSLHTDPEEAYYENPTTYPVSEVCISVHVHKVEIRKRDKFKVFHQKQWYYVSTTQVLVCSFIE